MYKINFILIKESCFMTDVITLATSNPIKDRELRAYFSAFEVEIKSPTVFRTPPEETGTTYEENALIKARYYAEGETTLVVADDSGLEIDVLEGFPGVYSAPFMEEAGGYERAFSELKSLIADKQSLDEEIRARFVCVLCVRSPNGEERLYRSRCPGFLVFPGRGESKGYDSIFIPDGYDKTFSEDPELKARLSPRAGSVLKLARGLKLNGK